MARLKLLLARLTPIAFAVITLGPGAFQTLSILWWGSGGK
jgi:hypothetical protein